MVTTQEILKKYGISQTDVKKLGEPQSPKLFGKEVEFKGATVGGARFDIKTPEDDLLKKYEVRTEKARAVKAEREAGGERLAGAQLDDLVGLANTINKLEDLLAEMKQKKYPTGILAGKMPYKQYIYGPEYEVWRTRGEEVFQQYRKAITGAQASVKELAYLRPIMPSEKDTFRTWIIKAEKQISDNRKKVKTTLNVLEKAGYNIDAVRDVYNRSFEEEFF
uniref:Uncharacterized protein n=1 Tax=viral metagenome TaxID=1070528 RepID=A0A6H1ZCU4_9ZZZZ